MKVRGALDLERLRTAVAQVQAAETAESNTRLAARERLLAHFEQQPLRAERPSRGAALWTIAAAAAVLLAVGGFWLGRPRALEFEAGPSATGHVGAPLVARPDQPLELRFSDGSRLALSPESAGRVLETTPQGAAVALEDGALTAHVVHRDASSWRVSAGPFTVWVTGTRFTLRWDAKRRVFAAELEEGGVTIVGPSLGKGGRKLLAGQHMQVALDERLDGLADGNASTAESAADLRALPRVLPYPAPIPSDALGPDRAPPVVSAPTAAGPTTKRNWRALALSHRYADALSAAEADGFDSVCHQATAADLVLLGDAARFSGSPSRAEEAYRAVRARFGGSHQAAIAAFSLGRLAADINHRAQDAVHWFKTYLDEAPQGALSREAAGRVIEGQRASGNGTAARESARDYLQKYPDGPHAALARSLLR